MSNLERDIIIVANSFEMDRTDRTLTDVLRGLVKLRKGTELEREKVEAPVSGYKDGLLSKEDLARELVQESRTSA
jgi:hypothetical protein